MVNTDRWETGDAVLDELVYRTIGCCLTVHRELGPGFLEKVYHRALELELAAQGIHFTSETEIDLTYRGKMIGTHILDLIVEGRLVLELKAVEELHKKHYAQVRSYLKATRTPLGLLINFSDYQLDPRRVLLRPA